MGPHDAAERLLVLAHEHFCHLTAPEREVLRAASAGEVADLAPWATPPRKPKKRNHGGAPLRSALVTWLCTDARAKNLVHRKGLCIGNATLDAELDLERAHVPFFLGLHNCCLPGLNAQRATLQDSLYLKHCRVDGAVDLRGATISGQLQCQGAWLFNKGGKALRADGATIGSDVFFSQGFCAVGEVRLLGANIIGQLDCEKGRFLNRGGNALNADNSTIGNNVYLSQGFCAVGEVRLLGAKITGQLDCKKGRFLNRGGDALSGDGATIGSDVFFSQGFCAKGQVRLPGANIIGQLDCKKGRFLNRGGNALNADRTTIGSSVFFSQGFCAVGEVRLLGANIIGQLNCAGGSFWAAKERTDEDALFLECAVIHGAVLLEPKQARGRLNLHRAEVTKALRMLAPAPALSSLFLSGAKVGLLLDARHSWPAQGKLHLDGFRYDDIDRDAPLSATERLDWLSRQPQGDFLPQPYEELAKFYQRTGHDSFAKDVRMAKEDAHQRHFKNPVKKAWWFLKWATVGYGYRPHFALGWFALIWLLCSGIFVLASPEGMTQSVSYQYALKTTPETLGNANATNYPEFNPWVYSLDVALPIVDLQQERYWMPNSEALMQGWRFWKSGAFLWCINWFEVLAGWFLASMGIAGATGIIRKD